MALATVLQLFYPYGTRGAIASKYHHIFKRVVVCWSRHLIMKMSSEDNKMCSNLAKESYCSSHYNKQTDKLFVVKRFSCLVLFYSLFRHRNSWYLLAQGAHHFGNPSANSVHAHHMSCQVTRYRVDDFFITLQLSLPVKLYTVIHSSHFAMRSLRCRNKLLDKRIRCCAFHTFSKYHVVKIKPHTLLHNIQTKTNKSFMTPILLAISYYNSEQTAHKQLQLSQLCI